MNAPDPKRILIIKLRAIGDVVMATPVIEILRRRFPDRHIAFLTEEASADIVSNNPFLDECITLPRRSWQALPWWKSWPARFRFYRDLRRRQFDLVIDLFGNPRSALLTLLSGAPHRLGYAFRGRKYCYTRAVPPRGGQIHEVEFHFDALRAIDVPVLPVMPRIDVPPDLIQKARQWLAENGITDRQKLIGLNPGGGWAIKRWPPDRFAALADALVEAYDARILLLWGPGEQPIIDAVVRHMKRKALVLPPASLIELAAYIQHCSLLISNDSGPMHIAAGLGVPTIGIFGPTNPLLQGPYGPGHRIVREETVPCLGCNRVTCDIGNVCMTHLEPETVLAAVREYFDDDA